MSHFKYVLGLGAVGAVVVACGGGVSLGDANQGLGAGASSSSGSSGSGTGVKKDCSAPNACGPALGMAAEQCSDGSIGGNTGKCIQTADGGCGWEIRSCPTTPDGGALVCFGKDGQLDPSLRKCNPLSASPINQCAIVTFQENCCGTMHAAGVNTASQTQAQTCGDTRGKGFPACGCASMGTVADDGSSSTNGETATVSCSAAGLCETTFKKPLQWYTTCGDPVCQDPGPDAGAPVACPAVGSGCTTKGETCGNPALSCGSVQVCDDHDPKGGIGGCPISTKKAKQDISYVGDADLAKLHDETIRMKLATYRYKGQFVNPNDPNATHLGFIVEDQPQSLSVDRGHDRVDLYGYMSMAVATMQVQEKQLQNQEKQIAALQKQVDALSKTPRK